ncbi:MAG: dephospho-CoA kinase [Fimbriimonadaceae bacterium]|nr:dephospho-CoA kinase [Fimbriimonadaceae bacterium]
MKIAVTGGIAEGKSTLVAALAQAGLRCISADEVAREVRAEPATVAKVADLFGIAPDHLDEGLRGVLTDPVARRQLNALMHPLVWGRMRETPHDVAEVPLLIESCLQTAYDYVVVVTCGEEEQRRRLTDRVGDAEKARQLLRTQLPTRAKLPFADRIVRTDGTLADVHIAAGKIAAVFRGTL